jgi:hypothetical protein
MATPKGKTRLPTVSFWQLLHRANLARWSQWAWSKTDTELAEEHGVCRERVRQIRLEIGARKAAHPHQSRKARAALQWAKDHLEQLKGLTWRDAVREYGHPTEYNSPLHKFLKPYVRNGRFIQKHRWDLMNFALPNRELERIWRLPPKMALPYRRRNQIPQSRWYSRQGRRNQESGGQGGLQAYYRAVKAEERKAAGYFAALRQRKP